MTPLESVLERLQERGLKTKRVGGQWEGQCPAHEDRSPSLSIGEGNDSKVLLHCQAGCTLDQIVGALGITLRDLFPPNGKKATGDPIVATYDYHDEQGTQVFQVVKKTGKQFLQRDAQTGKVAGSGTWKV